MHLFLIVFIVCTGVEAGGGVALLCLAQPHACSWKNLNEAADNSSPFSSLQQGGRTDGLHEFRWRGTSACSP